MCAPGWYKPGRHAGRPLRPYHRGTRKSPTPNAVKTCHNMDWRRLFLHHLDKTKPIPCKAMNMKLVQPKKRPILASISHFSMLLFAADPPFLRRPVHICPSDRYPPKTCPRSLSSYSLETRAVSYYITANADNHLNVKLYMKIKRAEF